VYKEENHHPIIIMTITLLDVMSDFSSIRTLVSVSRCSKLANQTTKQLIDRKTENAQEMRQLVLDIFPTIVNLPIAEDANYYRVLLETYFMGKSRRSCEVSYSVGAIIYNNNLADRYIPWGFNDELGSSAGRKKLLEAVEGWKHLGMSLYQLRRLQLISNIALVDFSHTRLNRIGSSFCW
jgi:hypothetical protein